MASKSRIRIEKAASGQWDSLILLTGQDSLGDKAQKVPEVLARIPYRGVLAIAALLSASMSYLVFLLFEDWRIAVGTWVGLMLLVTAVESSSKNRSHAQKRRRLEGSSSVGSVLSRYDFPERGTLGLMMTTRILETYEKIISHPARDTLVTFDVYALNESVWAAAVRGHRVAVGESRSTGGPRQYGIDALTLEGTSDPDSQDLRRISELHGHMSAALESLDRAQYAYDTHLSGEQVEVEMRVLSPIDNAALWDIVQRSEAVVLMNGGVPKKIDGTQA